MRYKIEWKHQQGPWFTEAMSNTEAVAWALCDVIVSWSESDRVRVCEERMVKQDRSPLGVRYEYVPIERPVENED